MASFLHPLASFAPRPGRVAMEDFFTEAFAGVLRADSRLLPAIIMAGETQHPRRLRPGCLLTEPDRLTIETQYRIQRGRPDLVALAAGRPVLIIESKFHAPFTEGANEDDSTSCTGKSYSQIPRYIEEVRQRGWNANVLLISLWPRPIDEPLDEDIYLGNLLWSDVYSAITSVTASTEERARVLRSELTALMEDLRMMPTQPLRFGDSQAYWACQQARQKMAALLDRAAAEISKEFSVELRPGREGKAYCCYRTIALDSLTLDVGLIFGDEGEPNSPIWPFIYVYPGLPPGECNRTRACQALQTSDKALMSTWPGQSALPTNEEMSRFLGAWEWEQQVNEFVDIIRGWFEKLAGAGLVQKTNCEVDK